jgi:hypothetical protein
MKKIIVICMIFILFVQIISCGNTKIIDGIEYDTYGLLNQDDKKNPEIKYKVIWGNVIWACILIETIIAPIYFFGFSLFEPTGRKVLIKGEVNKKKVNYPALTDGVSAA